MRNIFMMYSKIIWYSIFVLGLINGPSSAQDKKQFNVLLVTKTAGWHHESINEGVAAIKALATRNFFDVQWHQDGIPFTDKYLQNFSGHNFSQLHRRYT